VLDGLLAESVMTAAVFKSSDDNFVVFFDKFDSSETFSLPFVCQIGRGGGGPLNFSVDLTLK
jgi:hypothetical protein